MKLPHRALATAITLFIATMLMLCSHSAMPDDIDARIRLATTTSTDNSGLLDYLLPQFERDSGYEVEVISVGTGKALRLGQSGDVDVLLVHAPQSEQQFVARGFGVDRREVMANDFIIAGPVDDPANLRNAHDARDAFSRMHRAQVAFVSRGDDSGTHKKELTLWRLAGVDIDASNNWRREVGQGMGRSLQIADELRAYLLIDRATWLSLRKKTSLVLLFEGDAALRNPYGAIAVNPARHRVNYAGARALIDWLTSNRGRALIQSHRIDGAQLFTPSGASNNSTP